MPRPPRASPPAEDEGPKDQEILAFKKRAESDLLFFCQHVLEYRDLNERLHRPVVDMLMDTEKHKKLLLLPRGHLKSSLVDVGFSLWLLCNDPNRTIVLFSETTDLAKAFLREIKAHITGNDRLRMLWPLYPESPQLWTQDQIIVNRRRISRTPSIEAMGVNEATTGRHPDIMILDDVVTDRTVTNEEQIKKSKQTFRELQPLLEPPRPSDPYIGTEIVVGTRWHWDDLYNFIIEELQEYFDVMVRSAIENDEVIFPEKFSKQILEEFRRTLGSWVFSAQYMNQPVDADNAVFPHALIEKRRFHGDQKEFVERMPCRTYITVDPAWEEDGDGTGVVVAARAANNKLYVLEAHRLRLTPDKMIDTVAGLAVRWRVEKIGFEGVVGGQEWLARHLQTRLMEARRNIAVIPLAHKNRSKHARILGIVPELEHGRLLIHGSCGDLQTELIRYPRGKTDDLIDALAMMVSFATSPGRFGGRELPPEALAGTGEHEVALIEKLAARAERAKAMRKRRGGMPWR